MVVVLPVEILKKTVLVLMKSVVPRMVEVPRVEEEVAVAVIGE